MLYTWIIYVAAFLTHFFAASGAPSIDLKLSTRQSEPKYVFAHFMVGIVENYTLDDWKADMTIAQSIGIDAFALNCASIDSYTPTQLALSYQAAGEVGFKVFISFDFAYWNNGDTAKITSYMQKYAGHPAQMQYKGAALVSTFVGEYFDWGPVKQGTSHAIYALPNLESPGQASNNAAIHADGAFSWYAWPTDGGNSIIPGPMTTRWDEQFAQYLNGQTYMAPVSPWFSTHFASKNWVFICEDLPSLRWEEMLSFKPDLIEIITWNDYGESHYIGPYSAHHSDDGSSQWAKGMPHDAWRDLYKPYIAAYKSGASTPRVDRDQIVYWYRPTPKNTVCTGDPLAAPNGINMLSDSIFIATMLTNPATLTVTSGSNGPVSIQVSSGIVTSKVPMGVGAQSFSVTRNGQTILSGQGGLNVKDSCVYYNYNVYVGSITGTGGGGGPTTTSTTTSKPPTTTTTPITTPPPSSTTTTNPGSGNVCIGGRGDGNYIGLCQFCCGYGYCPPGPCTCTASGAPVPTPPTTGTHGVPLPGENDSYLGLCSFACNHGYCPPTACTTA